MQCVQFLILYTFVENVEQCSVAIGPTIRRLGSQGSDPGLLHGFHQDQRDEEAEQDGSVVQGQHRERGGAHLFINHELVHLHHSHSLPSQRISNGTTPRPSFKNTRLYSCYIHRFECRFLATGEEELLQVLQLLCQSLNYQSSVCCIF